MLHDSCLRYIAMMSYYIMLYIYIYVYIYVYTYWCYIYIYIYVIYVICVIYCNDIYYMMLYIYIYMHTYIHIYIYIYMCIYIYIYMCYIDMPGARGGDFARRRRPRNGQPKMIMMIIVITITLMITFSPFPCLFQQRKRADLKTHKQQKHSWPKASAFRARTPPPTKRPARGTEIRAPGHVFLSAESR